jgi:PKD repeat protein
VTSGIYFGTADTYLGVSQDLYLDIYAPTGDTLTKRPLIVYMFGGAFLIGTRNQPPIPVYSTYLAQCGYVVASIDYRIGFDVLSTGSAVRAVYRGIQDLRGAVRFLCQNYPQYNIDTTAIFLDGSSAGCISGIGSCFMETGDIPNYIHGITTEPSDLGCIDCADNTANNSTMPEIRGIVNHWGAILDTSFMRATPKDNVPMISLAGDQDNLVPYTVGSPFGYPVFPTVYGSLPMHYRMDDVPIRNELHPLVGYGHEPWLLAPQLIDTCLRYEVPFLYSILKPAPLTISGTATVCLHDEGTYSVPQRSGSHYCWSYSGGTLISNTGNAITIRWTTTGSHLITAREMTQNDVNGDLDSLYVNVVSRPVAAFGDSVVHTTVAYSDSSVGATSWAYSFGDGGVSSQENPSHTYSGENDFTTRLIVSNGYCADTAYRLIITDTCPAASIHYTISGDTVYLSADTSKVLTYSWTFGDGSSASDTVWTLAHTYSHTQSYLVGLTITTRNACTVSTSAIIAFTYVNNTTGISEANSDAYRIYPNPAHDQVNVDCGDCAVAIYDCLGRLVLSKYELNKTNIDIRGLDAGIYNISVTADGQTTNGRLVIQ